jgi:hypothetical protein
MTLLREFRHSIREMLASADVEANLISKGIDTVIAGKIARSRAVIASRSTRSEDQSDEKGEDNCKE